MVLEEKAGDDPLDNMVELIIPYDEGCVDPNTGRQVCGIPDRTLAALVNRAAVKHGNNITIVLDCCSSGHGTRGDADSADADDDEQLVVRAIDSDHLAPLYHNLDEELAVRPLPTMPKARRGRIKALAADHVLMAACGPREQALGNRREGGIFTALWLGALQREESHPRTYAEILEEIEAGLYVKSKPEKYKLLRNQHPQCDGIVRERFVFKEAMMRGDYFDAVRTSDDADNNLLEIAAGQAQGIEPNTLFEIHVIDKDPHSMELLGTAIAREVGATTCVAEHAQGIVLTQSKFAVLFAQPPERLIYEVVNEAPGSSSAQDSLRSFRESMADILPKHAGTIREATDGASADLRIYFNEDGSMTLHRLDPIVSTLRNAHPTLMPEEVKRANFGNILYGVARFNRLLAWSSMTHPVAGDIKFDLCPLVKRDGDADEGTGLRDLGAAIDVVDDEMTIVQREDEEEEYALVLSNGTPQELHVEIWYFDPSTYKIMPYYKSADPRNATLPGDGGRLQIGTSRERMDPLEFYLPEGMMSDTVFLKAFITDRPTKLRFLEQHELIGEDSDGDKVLLLKYHNRAGEGEIVAKGMWDTIVRKVTIVTPSAR